MSKVEELLAEDARNYTNLGTDSTKAERAWVKKESRRIYNEIKELDKDKGELLLNAMDKL